MSNNDPIMNADPLREHELMMTRRQLLGKTTLGLGSAALAQMMGPNLFANEASMNTYHHPPKAKRVIYLFMSGGPSHHDMWDYKPKMKEMAGEDLPEHVRDGQRITGMTSKQKTLPVAPSKYEFAKFRWEQEATDAPGCPVDYQNRFGEQLWPRK